MHLRATAMMVCALASAPFQCSSEPDLNQRMEETPAQALYELAAEFQKQGDQRARNTTLKRLIKRYPASRFAKMAQHDLDAQAAP